jgi:hypothetical protein
MDEIFNKLIKEKLTPNSLYVLHCIKNKLSVSKSLANSDLEVHRLLADNFPAKKLGSGKYARTNVKNLESGFRWFFENYDYTWETILKATRKYVLEYSMKNYEYMRTSQYFIRKQGSDKSFESDLATYCDMLNYEGPSEEQDIFREKIV